MMKRPILKILAALLAIVLLGGIILGYYFVRPYFPVNPKSVASLRVTEHPLGLEQGKDYAYSMALVGDTQAMNWKYPGHYLQMYDWVVANKDEFNIQYLVGLGDIADRYVEYSSKGSYRQDAQGHKRTFAYEWISAAMAHRKLNGVVPYCLNEGNHDYSYLYYQPNDDYNYKLFGEDYFNLAFNSTPSRLNPYGFRYMDYTTDSADYGFLDEERAEETWRRISIPTSSGTQNYLIFTIGYGMEDREDVLDWAKDIMGRYPEDTVILTVHSYLDEYGKYTNHLFENLVSNNPNVKFVFCGHSNNDNIICQNAYGAAGQNVLELMVNPHNLGDVGLIAILYFDNMGNPVGLEYYSTVLGAAWDEQNQIRF